VLVHVATTKGKGYLPAEQNPSSFHGVGTFDIDTGKPSTAKGGPKTYTGVFGETIMKLAAEDEKIVAITAAMPDGTGLTPFAKAYPERFFDVGIAEQHGFTFAAGLAAVGYRPVVAIYSTFSQRAYDQIFHDICLQKLPVTMALDRGGLVGDDGPTHHGVFDLSFLRHLPEMTLMAPKDENELQHMLKTALYSDRPMAIRYPRGAGYGVSLDQELSLIPIGQGEILSEGTDVAIIALGSTVIPALEAAQQLGAKGISAAVINARFVKPLDRTLILQVARLTGNIVTVEENVLDGGFGSAVLEVIHDEGAVGIRCKRLGIADHYVEQGTQAELRRELGIDSQGIAASVEAFLSQKSKPNLARVK
jgi:1-deoxy-D-xylulose-5-phosphate synthase